MRHIYPPGPCLSSGLPPDTEALGVTLAGPTGEDPAHPSRHKGGEDPLEVWCPPSPPSWSRGRGPCPGSPQDSLAEDHPILQPLLEVGSDLFSCDALDPRPQLSLLLWVILLGKLGGQWGDSSGRAPACTPNPSWGQIPPPWDGNGHRSMRMMLPADAAASEPFQKYEKELLMGLGASAPPDLSPGARGSSALSPRGPGHTMLSLSLPARPNLRHRFLGHRGYARNVDASSQMETSCQGRQHLRQRRLAPAHKGRESSPGLGREWPGNPECCPAPAQHL